MPSRNLTLDTPYAPRGSFEIERQEDIVAALRTFRLALGHAMNDLDLILFLILFDDEDGERFDRTYRHWIEKLDVLRGLLEIKMRAVGMVTGEYD